MDDLAIHCQKLARQLLERSAVFLDMREDWVYAFGPTQLNLTDWTLAPLDEQFYGGLSGIMLGFAAGGQMLTEPQFEEIAAQIYAQLERLLQRGDVKLNNLGWAGVGGSLIAIRLTEKFLEKPASLSSRLLKILGHNIEIGSCKNKDFLDGYAGLIVSLAQEHLLNEETCFILNVCRQKLAEYDENQWWPSKHFPKPLCGLSHGYSGFALAVGCLERMEIGGIGLSVTDLLSREDEYFDLSEQTWPDRRFEELKKTEAWCHGSGGIALARMQLAKWGYAVDLEKCKQAIQNVEEELRLRPGNHSLCHGDLGLLEVLFQCGSFQFTTLLRSILNGLAEQPLTGFSLCSQSPSFMVGYTGMAYQLLHFSAADKIPCILI